MRRCLICLESKGVSGDWFCKICAIWVTESVELQQWAIPLFCDESTSSDIQLILTNLFSEEILKILYFYTTESNGVFIWKKK